LLDAVNVYLLSILFFLNCIHTLDLSNIGDFMGKLQESLIDR